MDDWMVLKCSLSFFVNRTCFFPSAIFVYLPCFPYIDSRDNRGCPRRTKMAGVVDTATSHWRWRSRRRRRNLQCYWWVARNYIFPHASNLPHVCKEALYPTVICPPAVSVCIEPFDTPLPHGMLSSLQSYTLFILSYFIRLEFTKQRFNTLV